MVIQRRVNILCDREKKQIAPKDKVFYIIASCGWIGSCHHFVLLCVVVDHSFTLGFGYLLKVQVHVTAS
jgi:hypothetical protein